MDGHVTIAGTVATGTPDAVKRVLNVIAQTIGIILLGDEARVDAILTIRCSSSFSSHSHAAFPTAEVQGRG